MIERNGSWEMGRRGEREFWALLRSLGWTLIPTAEFDGNVNRTQAPMGLTGNMAFVLPDALALHPTYGYQQWAEVKTKSEPGFLEIRSRFEHGIDYVSWLDYRRAQHMTKIHVALVIHELKSPTNHRRKDSVTGPPLWLYISIDDAQRRGRRELNWPKCNGEGSRQREGGWLWPRDAMNGLGGQQVLVGIGGPF